jgi:hypothetical protein
MPTLSDPGFAPNEPTDNRKVGDWLSKYPKEARRKIKFEAFYILALLFTVPLILILIIKKSIPDYLNNPTIIKYSIAWLGGGFGGTLFDLKWLYHVVAKNIWNEDRRLWRLFIPHISGALSFAFTVVISSKLLNVFDLEALNKPATIFGIGFLVGYFSDNAMAKLSEVAETLFGAIEKHKSNKPDED